jgi:hypothetical protein
MNTRKSIAATSTLVQSLRAACPSPPPLILLPLPLLLLTRIDAASKLMPSNTVSPRP